MSKYNYVKLQYIKVEKINSWQLNLYKIKIGKSYKFMLNLLISRMNTKVRLR